MRTKALHHRFLLLILCMGIGNFDVWGQKTEQREIERPIFSSAALTVGRATLHDDYLSVNNYRGYEMGLMYEHLRANTFGNGKWVMRHRLDASAAHARSLSGYGRLIAATIRYSYGELYTLRFPCGLTLRTGGELDFTGGALYNPSNSNNPAAAKASLSLGLSEMLSYTLLMGDFPVTLRYHFGLPLFGIFFSPAFGESYYEMFYVGNRSGLVRFGFWHNRLEMSNLLTIELPIGRHALRLGYDNRIRTSRADHTRYFHFSNTFMVGLSTPIHKEKAKGTNPISAFY